MFELISAGPAQERRSQMVLTRNHLHLCWKRLNSVLDARRRRCQK